MRRLEKGFEMNPQPMRRVGHRSQLQGVGARDEVNIYGGPHLPANEASNCHNGFIGRISNDGKPFISGDGEMRVH